MNKKISFGRLCSFFLIFASKHRLFQTIINKYKNSSSMTGISQFRNPSEVFCRGMLVLV